MHDETDNSHGATRHGGGDIDYNGAGYMTGRTGRAAVLLFTGLISLPAAAQRLMPSDLIYRGAFRLPGPSGGSNWGYSGMAMTWYPAGDPSGPDDGFPGSLFASGHDHHQMIAEISIPVPVISEHRDPGDLTSAATLQPFTDVASGFHGELEIPVMGLAWLPPQGSQTEGKLHFCWGQHIQYREASYGWCASDLSRPASAGPWFLGDVNNYTGNDILFDIPAAWAGQHVQGRTLAGGRHREGVWSGLGPALYAIAPWENGDPPPPGTILTGYTPLLLYGEDDPSIPEIITDPSRKMTGYAEADQWTGGAWLTAGDRTAVIFVGTKAMGNSWYGFSDGTVWPYDGPYPEVPDPPHDQRGFWADSIHAQFIFYDPADLAAVAAGTMETWEPQPYAVHDFTHLLFAPGYDYWEGKRHSVGACAFDPEHGLLYVMERLADEDKSIVHVWETAAETRVAERREGPDDVCLSAWPNPFNGEIRFTFSVPGMANGSLDIYDLAGRRVAALPPVTQAERSAVWNASGRASGVYLAVLTAGGQRLVQKICLMK
ncbi:T9SS type A sorting domain-containing protein [bacterium]|nr:T9SS type A sorting domain-containing protein [bacterium]